MGGANDKGVLVGSSGPRTRHTPSEAGQAAASSDKRGIHLL